jgi:hypothetical protein
MNISHLKVISGGQTGADFAGLLAARRYGISTGGQAPKGFWTSLGAKPVLGEKFNLKESDEVGYQPRTIQNVLAAHVTLVTGSNLGSAGTALTLRKVKSFQTPYSIFRFLPDKSIESELQRNDIMVADLADLLIRKSLIYEHVVLNIAGNSTPSSVRSFDFTFAYCNKLFGLLFAPKTNRLSNARFAS